MKIIQNIFQFLFEYLVIGLEALVRFLNGDRHRLKGKFISSWRLLKRYHRGFNINGKSITPLLSRQGVLVNGETGSFKTAGVVIRSILTVDGSQINHDPSRELFEKTSGKLVQDGANIEQLDYEHPEYSLRFNPMIRANTPSQITQLATQLVTIDSEEKSADSFWDSKAIEVLFVLISILKTQELRYQNLFNVAYLLDVMQSKSKAPLVDRLFAKYSPDDALFTKFSSIVSNSENTLSSILATAQVSVQIFSLDEKVARITSVDTIGDFGSFRKDQTVLYIHSSTAKMRYYSKLTSIFLQQYFENFFQELPEKDDLDVYYHLDETPVLSINSLDIIASNIRKYRGALMCICQNARAQLTAKYGKRADAIITNLRTKVYLSADLQTATELERSLGRYEFIDKQDGEKMKSRALLNTDEIMSLPKYKVLVMISGMRAILTRLTPYFKVRKLREWTEIPPYENTQVLDTNSELPLLPLEDMFKDLDDEME